jgi:hypothetical protein
MDEAYLIWAGLLLMLLYGLDAIDPVNNWAKDKTCISKLFDPTTPVSAGWTYPSVVWLMQYANGPGVLRVVWDL